MTTRASHLLFLLIIFPVLVFQTGCGSQFNVGTVSSTANPLVASYTITPKSPAQVVVAFGPDTTYGHVTSTQSVSKGGTAVTILVAGMKASTTYHLKAVLTYNDNTKAQDIDHTFVTGSLPAGYLPSFTTQTTPGATPQPGVEMIDMVGLNTTAFVTDLEGNVIWYYPFLDAQPTSELYPIRLLPNGHLACLIAPISQSIATNPATPVPAGSLNVLREFDLAGKTIQQLSMADLNTSMAAAGFDVTLQLFSHDFQVLPNGHWLVIANSVKTYSGLVGLPGNTDVTGDVIVDLDENLKPVWYWSEFDHLDVNRHPYMFPDWTHTNSVTYSPDDHNFIVSLRHQSWIIKVDYQDGAGTGKILWKLGEGGDFKLLNGTDPTDWFYAQHNAVFASPNTSGIFSLALMDNGDDRVFPSGVTCGAAGAPACLYTTVPIMQINESAMTASFQFHQILPPSLYSYFGGNTSVLENTNVEYELAGALGGSAIFEVTQQATPMTVWQLKINGPNAYRGYRVPSLYPGVQW